MSGATRLPGDLAICPLVYPDARYALFAGFSLVTSIAEGLTYETANGEERTVSRRALYNAFRAHHAGQAETA
jgi:hypothetical protein